MPFNLQICKKIGVSARSKQTFARVSVPGRHNPSQSCERGNTPRAKNHFSYVRPFVAYTRDAQSDSPTVIAAVRRSSGPCRCAPAPTGGARRGSAGFWCGSVSPVRSPRKCAASDVVPERLPAAGAGWGGELRAGVGPGAHAARIGARGGCPAGLPEGHGCDAESLARNRLRAAGDTSRADVRDPAKARRFRAFSGCCGGRAGSPIPTGRERRNGGGNVLQKPPVRGPRPHRRAPFSSPRA